MFKSFICYNAFYLCVYTCMSTVCFYLSKCSTQALISISNVLYENYIKDMVYIQNKYCLIQERNVFSLFIPWCGKIFTFMYKLG